MQSASRLQEATVYFCFQESSGCPSLHSSSDGEPWQSKSMSYHAKRIYKTHIPFVEFVRFVMCNENKSSWYNPHKELSQHGTFILEDGSYNFLIQEPGEYIITNNILSKREGSEQEGERSLVAINVDGVLLGDEVSLVHFNVQWMKRFGPQKHPDRSLVYMTGRSIEELLEVGTLIRPDFVVTEGGTCVYGLEDAPEKILFSQLTNNTLSQETQGQIRDLEQFGFKKSSPKRNNSYMIPKQQLIHQNDAIKKALDLLDCECNMVEETEMVFFDFTPTNVNKKTALDYIKKLSGVTTCVCFGSNLSDYQMLMSADKCLVPINCNKRLEHLLTTSGKQFTRSRLEFAQSLIEWLADKSNQ